MNLIPFFKTQVGETLTDGSVRHWVRTQPETRYFRLLVLAVDEVKGSVTFEGWSKVGFTFDKTRKNEDRYHGTVTLPLEEITSCVHAQMVASAQLPIDGFDKKEYLA